MHNSLNEIGLWPNATTVLAALEHLKNKVYSGFVSHLYSDRFIHADSWNPFHSLRVKSDSL